MEILFLINGIFPAYWVGQSGFSLDLIQANFAYVLDANGWKIFKKNGISTALIPVDSVSGLAMLETKIDFTATKLPLELVRKVTAWFKAVYQKYRSEAVGYLFYRPSTGEWDFMPPVQTATGASAKYEEAPKREGWTVVGTIHSHGSMSAFHSGTDDADERFFDGVHITVGRCDSVPEYSCSLVVQGKREIVDPSILIDGMAPADEVPMVWLSAMKESAPRGLDILFQTQADVLYKRYFAGDLSEAGYKAELKKLEEADRKAQAEREAKKEKSSFGSHAVSEGYDGFGHHTFETTAKKDKKGARHGKW
jgi:PRTRC genetic system protein A